MPRASSLAMLQPAQPESECDDSGSRGGCACSATSAAIASTKFTQRSVSGGALTVCGLLGWLCIPKCPLCVATYFALGSGLTLTLAQSQLLRQSMYVAAASLILFGVWRLAKHGWRTIARRSTNASAEH
ncbi:hypothetical protein NA78x_005310 [Anatilimnocola sp. NA78]|uniref:hypothetical protein n=1 Tax=Anatilimnocola sp. NA78 TaxID=3415683 RepID=UPI003CE521DE